MDNGHDSDCAIHSAPAYPAGPCDCMPTQAMCRAAVVYMNGADVYDKLPREALEIEESIYAEVWKAMQAASPDATQKPARGLTLAAGARDGETAAQREVASLRVKLDACMASRDALRDWAQECRNQVLYVLAQQDNELGRAADGLGQASTDLLETNAGRRGEIDRLRQLLRGAELLFAPLCKDATAWNWLDATRTALGIGA